LATDGKHNTAMRTTMTKWISSQLVLHDFTTIFRFTAGYVEGGKRNWFVYILHQKKKLLRSLAMAGTRPSREETTRKITSIYKWATQLWTVYTLHLKKERVGSNFAFNEETLQVVCTGWTMTQ